MRSISEGFVLSKVISFAGTMGLILATIANLPHSASAANRGGLWAVVHDICVPAYQSIGVGFPCAERRFMRIYAAVEVLFGMHYAEAVTVDPTTQCPEKESAEPARFQRFRSQGSRSKFAD
jgi:hypothetical protein